MKTAEEWVKELDDCPHGSEVPDTPVCDECLTKKVREVQADAIRWAANYSAMTGIQHRQARDAAKLDCDRTTRHNFIALADQFEKDFTQKAHRLHPLTT